MASLHFYQPHADHDVVTTSPVSAEIAYLIPMSHPRLSPAPLSSNSPSKSSLRSAGAVKEQMQNKGLGLGLLPSPGFEGPDRTTAPASKTVGFEGAVYEVGGLDSIEQAQVDFQPFFTLINDSVTAEHYHPTVHYVFKDDEEGEEMVSESVLRSLQSLEQVRKGKQLAEEDTTAIREHILILNVDVKSIAPGEAAGYEVVQAQSLSADWQVSNVEVTSAPTMSEEDANGGLMLKIAGRGPAIEDTRGHEMGRESLEDMVSRYQEGLEEIRKMAALEDDIACEHES